MPRKVMKNPPSTMHQNYIPWCLRNLMQVVIIGIPQVLLRAPYEHQNDTSTIPLVYFVQEPFFSARFVSHTFRWPKGTGSSENLTSKGNAFQPWKMLYYRYGHYTISEKCDKQDTLSNTLTQSLQRRHLTLTLCVMAKWKRIQVMFRRALLCCFVCVAMVIG